MGSSGISSPDNFTGIPGEYKSFHIVDKKKRYGYNYSKEYFNSGIYTMYNGIRIFISSENEITYDIHLYILCDARIDDVFIKVLSL